MSGGLMYDERFLNHRSSYDHPERPARLREIWCRLSESGIVPRNEMLPGRRAKLDELLLGHDESYVRKNLDTIRGEWGYLDGDTFFSPGTEEAVLLAVGGTIDLARKVRNGSLDWGFSLPRPPGHHAVKHRAMGFCIFNNIALAAAALLADGIERILIFDWDVHHGNGTQNIFEDSDRVLFISVHQWPHFPGTGLNREIGVGRGKGFTANVPFPAGSADGDYAAVMQGLVLPLVRSYEPEMILVSAGFDAYEKDMLAGMRVTVDGFAHMAGKIRDASKQTGKGPCLVLEGGYHLEGLAESVEAVIRVLEDGGAPQISARPSHGCLESIDATISQLKPYWSKL